MYAEVMKRRHLMQYEDERLRVGKRLALLKHRKLQEPLLLQQQILSKLVVA